MISQGSNASSRFGSHRGKRQKKKPPNPPTQTTNTLTRTPPNPTLTPATHSICAPLTPIKPLTHQALSPAINHHPHNKVVKKTTAEMRTTNFFWPLLLPTKKLRFCHLLFNIAAEASSKCPTTNHRSAINPKIRTKKRKKP